jgi:hypothetical protein
VTQAWETLQDYRRISGGSPRIPGFFHKGFVIALSQVPGASSQALKQRSIKLSRVLQAMEGRGGRVVEGKRIERRRDGIGEQGDPQRCGVEVTVHSPCLSQISPQMD